MRSLCLSVSPFLSISLTFKLPPSPSLSLPLSPYLSLSLSLLLSISLTFKLSSSLSIYLSLSLYLSIYLIKLSSSLSIYLSLFLSLYPTISLTFLPLRTHLSVGQVKLDPADITNKGSNILSLSNTSETMLVEDITGNL